MSNNLYVGMSSGPIFELMQYARATKEHWLASYMFSRYSHYLVKTLGEELGSMDIGFDLLSPALKPEQTKKPNPLAMDGDHRQLRIGLYSDRIFFRVDESAESLVRAAVEKAIDDAKAMLANVICNIILRPIDSCKKAVDAVVYTCCVYRHAKKIPLREMNMALDERELFAGDRPEEGVGAGDEWDLLFDKEKLKSNRCSWISDSDLRGADLEDVAGAKQEGYRNTQASNYYAVIVADGDGVGTVLGNTSELENCDERIKKISEGLLQYANQASLAVLDYETNAYPVYFGGDDMECFVPLYSMKHNRNFIDLIIQLDQIFKGIFIGNSFTTAEPEEEKNGIPGCENCTTSFAVNIVYFKYPLNRAINEAHDLLSEAKKADYDKTCVDRKDSKFKKNTVYIQLRKHSGQTSRVMLSKADNGNHNAWDAFIKYLKLKESETIIHQIHHRLMAQKVLLLALVQLDAKKRKERILAWLKNQQEETPISPDYMERIADLLIHLWECRPWKADAAESCREYLKNIDGTFRLGELMDLHAAQTREKEKEEGAP